MLKQNLCLYEHVRQWLPNVILSAAGLVEKIGSIMFLDLYYHEFLTWNKHTVKLQVSNH